MLIVEDDRTTADALRAILAYRGYDAHVAYTLSEGRAALTGESGFRYLVLDLMLPDGDGAELLRQIRDQNLPVRVAVTTAVNDLTRLRTVAQLSPECVLRKPIELSQLLSGLKLVH